MNETFLAVFVSRPASRLLGYSGTDSIADAFPASTQFEPPLLCDQLEAVIQGLLEPFCLWRFGVTHRRKPLLQYIGICRTPIDDNPISMPHPCYTGLLILRAQCVSWHQDIVFRHLLARSQER